MEKGGKGEAERKLVERGRERRRKKLREAERRGRGVVGWGREKRKGWRKRRFNWGGKGRELSGSSVCCRSIVLLMDDTRVGEVGRQTRRNDGGFYRSPQARVLELRQCALSPSSGLAREGGGRVNKPPKLGKGGPGNLLRRGC